MSMPLKFANLAILIYSPQHLNAASNELERLGYTCDVDYTTWHHEERPATFIRTSADGKYTVFTLDYALSGTKRSGNYPLIVIRRLRRHHCKLRVTVSQDALSTLAVQHDTYSGYVDTESQLRPIATSERLEQLSAEYAPEPVYKKPEPYNPIYYWLLSVLIGCYEFIRKLRGKK